MLGVFCTACCPGTYSLLLNCARQALSGHRVRGDQDREEREGGTARKKKKKKKKKMMMMMMIRRRRRTFRNGVLSSRNGSTR
eukprot:758525-Hanusia_phi.AAC.1